MKDGRRRVLKVGTRQYLWKAGHQHRDGCEEVRPDGTRQVADGGTSASGDIWIGERMLNLNEPGVVRAFVDSAVDVGWMAQTRTAGRRDGWELFDTAYVRHSGRSSRGLR
ncbi:hypothetical protein ACFXNW_10570 [Nocardia sp. NPDC059180]|uniref:hypothetical protein n=1 Tax=Nocardia sp. NPDC059180 TaxID=3346761 RepID=UPI0036982EAD